MKYSPEIYAGFVRALVPEWTRRRQLAMIHDKGPGCFVWNSKTDGTNGSGKFYAKEMLQEHFHSDMAADLQQLIDQADHDQEVVGALLFDDNWSGARFSMSRASD
jgi:hypothetical protein